MKKVLMSLVVGSVFVLAANVFALDLEYVASSPGLEYGEYSVESKKLKAALTFAEGAEFRRFKLVLAETTIDVWRGTGDENPAIRIKGTSNSTGETITLSQKEYRAISRLLSNIDYSRWGEDCGRFLYSCLNLLESWPPSLPVFAVIADGKTIYMTPEQEMVALEEDSYSSIWGDLVVPEGKELEAPPGPGENLCEKKRSYVEGHVLVFGERLEYNLQEAWTETFLSYLDDTDRCNGRCGIGCTRDMSDRITYTQRCFNHDECVAWYGYFASSCNAMFVHCIDDYYSGPICYELWVSSHD